MRRIDYIVTIDNRQFCGEIEFHRGATLDEVMHAIGEDIRPEMLEPFRQSEQEKDHEQYGQRESIRGRKSEY